jgi:hypothetical protein
MLMNMATIGSYVVGAFSPLQTFEKDAAPVARMGVTVVEVVQVAIKVGRAIQEEAI